MGDRKTRFRARAWIWAYCLTAVLPLLTACYKERHHHPPQAGAFAEVKESDLVGRYKWIENGFEGGYITLNANHSVIRYDGVSKPGYRWELQKEGLCLIWAKGFNFFPTIVEPGIYEGQRDSKLTRIEKQ